MTRSAKGPVATDVEILRPQFEAPPDLRARLVRLAAETAASEVKSAMDVLRPQFEAPPDLRARLVHLAAETAADEAQPTVEMLRPERGKIVLRVGSWLFGLSVLACWGGGQLITYHYNVVLIVGLFLLAAVFGISGLLCMLVGAILYLYLPARARSKAAMYAPHR